MGFVFDPNIRPPKRAFFFFFCERQVSTDFCALTDQRSFWENASWKVFPHLKETYDIVSTRFVKLLLFDDYVLISGLLSFIINVF